MIVACIFSIFEENYKLLPICRIGRSMRVQNIETCQHYDLWTTRD